MDKGRFPTLPKGELWLVTGGAGFIGSHLVEYLLRAGQRVRVIDNLATGKRENIEKVKEAVGKGYASSLEFLEGDIRDRELCKEAVKGVVSVLHQAALGSVPRSFTIPVETHEVNVTGFVTLLEAARQEAEKGQGLRSFVYASSSSVYGDSPTLPKLEEQTGRVLSPYAASKAADELYADAFQGVCPFSIVGLRYFNVFGPRQDPLGPYAAVIPKWMRALREENTCTIYGDGKTSRDFCYVENVVLANLLAATSEIEGAELFNVAAGEQTTLLELHEIMAKEFAQEGAKCDFEPFRDGDVRHSLADISKIHRMIGYAPRVRVREGISRTIAYEKKKVLIPNSVQV